MKKEFEDIEWNSEINSLVITTQKTITLDEVDDIKKLRTKLKWELGSIVSQVKDLKKRAEEIKSTLLSLEGKAGSIDPAE